MAIVHTAPSSVSASRDTDNLEELSSVSSVKREIERLTRLQSDMVSTTEAKDYALLATFLRQTREERSEAAQASAADVATIEADEAALAGGKAALPPGGASGDVPTAHQQQRRVLAHLDSLQQTYFGGKHDLESLAGFSRILGRIAGVTASPVRTLRASTHIVSALAWDRDGCVYPPAHDYFRVSSDTSLTSPREHLAACSTSRTIRVYDAREWETQFPVLDLRGADKFSDCTFSPFSRSTLLASDYRGVLSLFDTLRGRVARTYDEHSARVWSVGWSGLDPATFVSGGDDCHVKLWSNKARRSTATIELRVRLCVAAAPRPLLTRPSST